MFIKPLAIDPEVSQLLGLTTHVTLRIGEHSLTGKAGGSIRLLRTWQKSWVKGKILREAGRDVPQAQGSQQ